MKTERNFYEILEEISDSALQTPLSPSTSAGWESALDPWGLSQIIGTIPVYKTGYKKYKSVPQPRKPHSMNIQQILAFENLSLWAPTLTNVFNSNELKSCYRTALLKTHPDQGGNAESFLSVKKSYEILRSLVKS